MTGKEFKAESTLEMIDGILRLRKQVDIQRRVKEEIQKIQRHRKILKIFFGRVEDVIDSPVLTDSDKLKKIEELIRDMYNEDRDVVTNDDLIEEG